MSAYRFCRTDDIPLLVETHNRCWRSAFPEAAPLTAEAFKRGARRFGLWASSSMLAIVGDEPVGVLLGAKRDDANLVHRLAILPEHRRAGHGRHLLESLTRKVAILGPPRLEVELPAGWADTARFLEAAGFRVEGRSADLVLEARLEGGPGAAGAAVGLEELVEAGALAAAAPRAWRRRLPQLRALGGELRGAAIASDVRVEAFVLHRPHPTGSSTDVLALGAADQDHGRPLLRALLAGLYEGGSMIRIPRVSDAEAPRGWLEALGFRAAGEWTHWAIDPRQAA